MKQSLKVQSQQKQIQARQNINKQMNKSSLEKLLKTDAHYSTDLVSLDFKSQSLNRFLQNVVNIVNQHSSKINALEMNKINADEVKLGNIQLFNASRLPPSIIQELPLINVNEKPDTYNETIESLGANMVRYGHGFQYLMDMIKKQNNKINSLADNLSTFETIENVKQQIKKSANTAKKFTEDEISKLTARFKQLDMNTSKKLNGFENLTKEMEKKTLWKITQCEEALMKKITPEYVDKALEQYENQIMFKIDQGKNQALNELKFQLENAKAKLENLSHETQENQKENKKMIKELQEQCKGFESSDKIEMDLKEVQTKFKQMLIKIDKLQKRQHPQDLQLRITKITAEHGQKINAHHERLKKLDIQLSSINNIMSSMGSGSGGSFGDPHKLCQMDGEVRKLRDATRTLQAKVHTNQDQLKTKLLVFEQRIMTTLSMIKGQDHFVSRQQLYQSISRLRQPLNQRMNEHNNLINQVNSKINKFQLFQKSTKKKIKDMTKGDELNKILDLKMNTGTAQTQFNAMNMKLQALQIVMNKIKMQMESNSDFLRMIQKQINEPQEGFNILGPKAKVFPAKCLGCGIKHIPTYENNMMEGSDGKLYKVDLKKYGSEVKEVYGVTQSQIATYDSPLKSSMTKTRPTSGKTMNVRPASSKYL